MENNVTNKNMDSVELTNNEEDLPKIKERAEEVENQKKKTLFNDLRRFKRSKISILTYGGQVVYGKLLGYDEVANCVLESDSKKQIIVFGKVISLIAKGEMHAY